jgi:hypothetical protein
VHFREGRKNLLRSVQKIVVEGPETREGGWQAEAEQAQSAGRRLRSEAVSGRWKSMGERSIGDEVSNAEPGQTGVVESQQPVAMDRCLRWKNASQKVTINSINSQYCRTIGVADVVIAFQRRARMSQIRCDHLLRRLSACTSG